MANKGREGIGMGTCNTCGGKYQLAVDHSCKTVKREIEKAAAKVAKATSKHLQTNDKKKRGGPGSSAGPAKAK